MLKMNLSTSAANGVSFASEAKRFAIFALVDWLRNGTIIFSVIAVSLYYRRSGMAVERADVQRMNAIKIDRLPITRWLHEFVGGEGGLEGFLRWLLAMQSREAIVLSETDGLLVLGPLLHSLPQPPGLTGGAIGISILLGHTGSPIPRSCGVGSSATGGGIFGFVGTPCLTGGAIGIPIGLVHRASGPRVEIR